MQKFTSEVKEVIDNQKQKVRVSTLILLLLSLNHGNVLSQTAPSVAAVDLNTVDWIHGSENCEALLAETKYQEWQQIEYQPDSFVFRQNKCSDYEGPFVYFFVGQDKGLLIDTGATIEGGEKLTELISTITDLPLVVAHSHGHGDHRMGDGAFAKGENVSLVGTGENAVSQYFGFSNWPNESIAIDLGDREIQLLPIPGHNDDDLAYYDSQTNIVVTGDTLYPGRLYVKNWAEYRKSIKRLADWVSEKSVSHVMGTHIEMSAIPNSDYAIGTTYQPDEDQLPLSVDDIYLLRDSLETLESPERTPLGRFIIWPI